MRLLRFLDETGAVRYGRAEDGTDEAATLLEGDLFGGEPPGSSLVPTGDRVRVAKRLAPVDPRAILCIGLNYRDHAEETGQPLPERPVLFMKNPASVQHPGDPIRLPPSCLDPPQVDYEAELAVVIGRAVTSARPADALASVLGYTLANDVSARRWQKHAGGGQWVRGKSFDTFCPLGPALHTPEDVPDPQDLSLTTEVNGRRLQASHTSRMIFTVAELLADLSNSMTLLPGTVVLTGTPAGVGFVRDPQVFLHRGDRVTLRSDALGELTSPVA